MNDRAYHSEKHAVHRDENLRKNVGAVAVLAAIAKR
jgi:hypothetical protein